MKILLATILLLSGASAFASASAEKQAFRNMEKALNGTPFLNPRLSPDGRLVVEITDLYEPKPKPFSKRDQWVETLCQTWTEALHQANSTASPLAAILSPHGGTVYECVNGESSEVKSWDDRRMPFTEPNPVRNFLLSAAGQFSLGTTPSTWGFNFSEVMTMYKDIWDFGFSESLISTNTTVSIGLIGRARPRFTDTFGMTLGIQPLVRMAVPSGGSLNFDFVLGGQVGFNFYTPGGSVDLTTLVQSDGTYTLAAGYTFFLNRTGAQ